MERGLATQLQAFSKSTLLALAILSMATSAPHVYACLRSFFLVSIPCAVSAVVTPKCLFVFSNIIVVFLANESKLSRSSAPHPVTASSEGYADAAKHQQSVSTPVDKERDGELAAEEMITEEEEEEDSTVAVRQSLPQLDQCDQLLDHASSTIAGVEMLREDVQINGILVANFGDGECMEVEDDQHLELGRIELREEVIDEEACEEEEEMGLPADELNRRVEEFIARFNIERHMERQLEAGMLVCCF